MQGMSPCDAHGILVIDDDASIRALLTDFLSDEGYTVETAGNGSEALAVLNSGFRPCLILLDLNMPIMSGWEFCSAQRRRPDLAGLPVALMSAANNLAVAQPPCRPAAVFSKPFDLFRLLSTIRTIAA